MQLPVIISSILGLSKPWKITDISFSDNYRRLDITVDYSLDDSPQCPYCNARKLCADKDLCTWFNKDFLSYETYLHARTPHRVCCETGARITPPWSREGSSFVQI